MAMAIHTSEKVSRRDEYSVNPYDILISEENRGRTFRVTQDQVIEKAMSIYDNGQLTPIECRRINTDTHKNVLASVYGYTRTNAIRLIREGFTGTDGVYRKDETFKVRVNVVDVSDEKAFVHNIIENEHRNDCSDIDTAHNQDRLRQKHGWTDTKIAELYRCSGAKVGKLRQLLRLTEEEQLMVHTGVLSTSAALELLELPEDKRSETILEIQTDPESNGKITAARVADQIRESVLADANGSAAMNAEGVAPTPKTKARNMKNLKTFLEDKRDGEETDKANRRLATDLLKWLGGKTTDKQLENALERFRNAE